MSALNIPTYTACTVKGLQCQTYNQAETHFCCYIMKYYIVTLYAKFCSVITQHLVVDCCSFEVSMLIISLAAPPSNVNITDSGLTANTVAINNSTTMYCSASGTDPLQYRWYHNRYHRNLIPGANNTTYTVSSAGFSDAGEYTCEVSNWAGKDQGTYTLNVQSKLIVD